MSLRSILSSLNRAEGEAEGLASLDLNLAGRVLTHPLNPTPLPPPRTLPSDPTERYDMGVAEDGLNITLRMGAPVYWNDERRGPGFVSDPNGLGTFWNEWRAMEKDILSTVHVPLESWEVICGNCWLIHRKGVCDRDPASSAY